MTSKFYDIPEQYCNPLKEAFYDLESYRSIMTELVKTPNEETFDYAIFNDFRKHYKEALIKYDTEKINFEFDYVKALHPNANYWNVTFGDNKVEIHYQD